MELGHMSGTGRDLSEMCPSGSSQPGCGGADTVTVRPPLTKTGSAS